MLEVIGDAILMLAIIGGGVLFIKANVNYLPNKETSEGNKNKIAKDIVEEGKAKVSDNPDFIDYDGMGNQGRFPKR